MGTDPTLHIVRERVNGYKITYRLWGKHQLCHHIGKEEK